MNKAQKNTEVAGQDVPVEIPAPPAEQSDAKDSPKQRPVWDAYSNRVKVAIWKYRQDDGSTRCTAALYRSYVDDEEKRHNVYYYGKRDLKDVIRLAEEALDQIERIEATAVAAATVAKA